MTQMERIKAKMNYQLRRTAAFDEDLSAKNESKRWEGADFAATREAMVKNVEVKLDYSTREEVRDEEDMLDIPGQLGASLPTRSSTHHHTDTRVSHHRMHAHAGPDADHEAAIFGAPSLQSPPSPPSPVTQRMDVKHSIAVSERSRGPDQGVSAPSDGPPAPLLAGNEIAGSTADKKASWLQKLAQARRPAAEQP
eukprot:m.161665 g.161665  ORF g.161665 m.161665 type:complete len:195 (+) comp15198_c4_seq1:3229-3813(+)